MSKSISNEDRATASVLVEIRNKRLDAQKHQNFIWWDATYHPVGINERTGASKGTVEFADLFGEVKFRLQIVINDPMEPGRKLMTPGVGFKYNQFMQAHQWMLSTDLSNMKVQFRVKSIIYMDGRSEEF